MAWLFLLGSASAALFLWNVIALFANYQSARQIGLPIVISPIFSLNPFWILLHRSTPILPFLKSLPFNLGKWARCNYIGWQFDGKYALHKELGDAFLLVSPSKIELMMADADAVNVILGRRKEYIKPAMMYEQMDIFGPSVNTVEGDTWQRHRKLTAPSFNDRTSRSVWNEALLQTQDMLQSWVKLGNTGTKDIVGDTKLMALHVLTCAGFGMKFSYSEGMQSLRPGYTMTYRDALQMILRSITLLVIFPQVILRSSFVPKKLRDLGHATRDFKRYMEEMLARERKLILEQESGTDNLMSALVRASEEAKEANAVGGTNKGLTDDEIFGNIFMYNLAGHDTTANAVAYAIVLLAAFPKRQEWLAEEINSVFGDQTDIETWEYESAFPKLKRSLATLFETLRLYGSVVFIPKSTGSHAQTLTIKNKDYLLPPDTWVTTNSQALHTNPRIWGPDALDWRPERWLTTRNNGKSESETFIEPAKGTYVPWAEGPRACLGRKFAQVEFVAVMAALFHKHRVRPALSKGESALRTRERLLEMVNESGIFAITLQMERPKRVPLVWELRH